MLWARQEIATAAIAIAIWMLITNQPAPAQFLPRLQAKTPAEFDAYLDVAESKPEDRIRRAREFLSAYPESDMRLRVHELLAEACRVQGDVGCAREASAAGLAVAPDYVPLLTLAASIEANTSARPDTRAAERALVLLDQVKAPRTLDAGTWLRETARLRAENLATLGIAAFKRGDSASAIRRLKESVRVHPLPANQYRLAMLYLETRRRADAAAMLERVVSGADPALREKAAAALRDARIR